ncbi:hypothetical protein FCV25MIE_03535, partial [Fagus crenata]
MKKVRGSPSIEKHEKSKRKKVGQSQNAERTMEKVGQSTKFIGYNGLLTAVSSLKPDERTMEKVERTMEK